MNVRTALGVAVGLTVGLVGAPLLLRRLYPAAEGINGNLPLSLDAAREFLRDPDAAVAELMKLWEHGAASPTTAGEGQDAPTYRGG